MAKKNKIKGTRSDDDILGTNGVDHIDARHGDDIVHAGDGADKVKGGKGADWLYGEAGDDFLDGGKDNDYLDATFNDYLDGVAGDDLVFGQQGDDTGYWYMQENLGATDSYDGGTGTDAIVFALTYGEAADAGVQADLAGFDAFLALNSDLSTDNGATYNFTSYATLVTLPPMPLSI